MSSGVGFVATDQWIRDVKLTFSEGSGAAIDISDLRIQFQVRQKTQQHPDHMYVRVTNLSDQTAMGWFKVGKGAKAQLEAGYRNRVGKIFDGQVMQMRIGKEPNGVDKYFDCMATSSQTAYGFARLNKTLAAGYTYKDVVDLATQELQKAGIRIGHIGQLSQTKFPRAGSFYGLVRDTLRDVAQANKMTWTIFNNELQMVKVDGYLPGTAKVLNSSTGMIGMPEMTLDGIVVKMLLDPGMKVGQQVQINERSIQKLQATPTFTNDTSLQESQMPAISPDGLYKVWIVDHDGDTKGTEWYTTILCTAVGDQGLAAGRAKLKAFIDVPTDDQDTQGGGQ